MRDFLFACGVFDDDDRPAPKLGPVRNVDEQPIQAHQWQHFCPGCGGLLVDPSMLSGLCKPCHASKEDDRRKKEQRKATQERARLDVAAIVGNLCAHCGVRRRKYLSRYCGQRACERHE